MMGIVVGAGATRSLLVCFWNENGIGFQYFYGVSWKWRDEPISFIDGLTDDLIVANECQTS